MNSPWGEFDTHTGKLPLNVRGGLQPARGAFTLIPEGRYATTVEVGPNTVPSAAVTSWWPYVAVGAAVLLYMRRA